MTGYIGDGAPIDAGNWTANAAQIQQQGYSNVQTSPGDASMHVIFYKRAVQNAIKSAEAGRPIYVGVDFVRIQQPGERLNIVEREVLESDKRRWPQNWGAYAAGKDQIPVGTPLGLLFPRHPEAERNMQALGFLTVEQLANASASAIDAIGMHGQDYVNYAQNYLKAGNSGAGFHQMQRENEEMKRQNDRLHRQVADLTEQVAMVNQAILAQAGIHSPAVARSRMPAPAPAEPTRYEMPAAPSFGNSPMIDSQTTMIDANHESADQAPKNKPGWPAGKKRGPRKAPAAT
jgi:hypothetical protein